MDDDVDEEESVEQNWAAELSDGIRPVVAAEWRRYLADIGGKPQANLQLWTASQLIRDLFFALHCSAWISERDGNAPQFFWRHQQIGLFHEERANRRFEIDREELLQLAARYLSSPEIRTNKLDWIFLDAIVFQELEAYAIKIFNSRGGTGSGVNLAAVVARNGFQYMWMKPLFWLGRILLWWGAPLAFTYYLFANSHPVGAAISGGWLALGAIWELATYPLRFRARRRARKLLEHLAGLYSILAQSTIPPTRWERLLDAAAAEGVVLDGAVFTLIDRAIARDPTALLPFEAL